MTVVENKTKPTGRSVEKHIAAVQNEAQRQDCLVLVGLLRRITKEEPKMWGPSIIGFGSYHYKYASGREGDAPRAGLAVRGNELVVYVDASGPDEAVLLGKLGRHRMGKSCLYIRKVRDIDTQVLERLVAGSVAELKRRYGPGRDNRVVQSTKDDGIA